MCGGVRLNDRTDSKNCSRPTFLLNHFQMVQLATKRLGTYSHRSTMHASWFANVYMVHHACFMFQGFKSTRFIVVPFRKKKSFLKFVCKILRRAFPGLSGPLCHHFGSSGRPRSHLCHVLVDVWLNFGLIFGQPT